jgi:hypothetical protein
MKQLVKKKVGDKQWRIFGSIKENKFGNTELGVKVTQEVKDWFANAPLDSWLNFAIFEDKEAKPAESTEYEPF